MNNYAYFSITGCIALYRGVVEKQVGKYNRPEIRVTHIWSEGRWATENTWPILKDGDYITREKDDLTPEQRCV